MILVAVVIGLGIWGVFRLRRARALTMGGLTSVKPVFNVDAPSRTLDRKGQGL